MVESRLLERFVKSKNLLRTIYNKFTSLNLTPVIPTGDWILLTGFWDDAGIWDDTANWID